VAAEEARRWAKEQSEIVHLAYDDAEQQAQCTELAIHFGATVRTTPIARHLSRWMSLDDISEWATKQDVIKLVTEDGIWSMLHEKYDEPREWTPSPQLLTIPQRSTTVLDVGVNESWPSDSEDDATGAIIEVIAEAWKTTSGAIRKTMDSATVGERDGEPLSFRRVLVVERPVPP
jgi:hypothetical protein